MILTNIHIDVDGAIMDDNDVADLRAIELALQNPRSGTPAAAALDQLAAQIHQRDVQLFPTISHPRTGALCFCQTYCSGDTCRCWCHAGESP
jgi:hypothetical protein